MRSSASIRSRLLARLVDWVVYVIVGPGLALALILGLLRLEVTFVRIGDEGLVENRDHYGLARVERDGTIPIDEIIQAYETGIMGRSNSYADLISEIREEFPNDFSGSAFKDDYTIWIAFAGQAPTAAVEAIRIFSQSIGPIDMIENRGYSEIDVLDEQWHAISRVKTFSIEEFPDSLEWFEQSIIFFLFDLPPPWYVIFWYQLSLLALVAFFVVELPLTAICGQTVGKMLNGTRVIRVDGGRQPGWLRSSVRWIVLYIPLLVPIVGLLLFLVMIVTPLFDSRRRGLHDRIAGTLVVSDLDSERVTDHV